MKNIFFVNMYKNIGHIFEKMSIDYTKRLWYSIWAVQIRRRFLLIHKAEWQPWEVVISACFFAILMFFDIQTGIYMYWTMMFTQMIMVMQPRIPGGI